MKINWFGILFLLLGLQGCISAEKARDLDRNDHNQPQANLKTDIHTMSSPASGLRGSAQGTSACTACAH